MIDRKPYVENGAACIKGVPVWLIQSMAEHHSPEVITEEIYKNLTVADVEEALAYAKDHQEIQDDRNLIRRPDYLSKEDCERLLWWYGELNPNKTDESDFLPNAILARKLQVWADKDEKFLEIQDSLIKDLSRED
jgi:uncharacterized protein (DUF433 family)